MRRVFTADEAIASGLSRAELRWGTNVGRWQRVARGVYVEGPDEPTPFDRAVAEVLLVGGVASGTLAGVLHSLDGVRLAPGSGNSTAAVGRSCRRSGTRHRRLEEARIVIVAGLRCTDGRQTLIDLAAGLDDDHWEQALESAIRHGIASIAALEADLPALGRTRTPGTRRVRRVLGLRPQGAPATESLLETLMVQLARGVGGLDYPSRQVVVLDRFGSFVARVDLAWPDLGLFVELDGQHHLNQPCYDSRRETAVVAATGWLCARFTWNEVTRLRATTTRRLADLVEQARLRPLRQEPPRRSDQQFGS